jgi:hypothetical protein
VARDDNGKIMSHAVWSRKFSLEKAKKIFKENMTFNKDVIRNIIGKYKTAEYIDLRDRPRKPYSRSARVQYVVEGTLPNGKKITARSEQHSLDYPKSEMKEEAYENFYLRLADSQNLQYDAAEGKDVFDRIGNIKVREGFVYYVFAKVHPDQMAQV